MGVGARCTLMAPQLFMNQTARFLLNIVPDRTKKPTREESAHDTEDYLSTSARRHTMRFHEFATPARPVLKISQQAQASASASANTLATPLPQNTVPTAAAPAEPIRVYPRQWQRAWLQKYLAAKMARSAQTIKPTADDLAIASIRYGEAQRQADQEYERRTGVAANPDRRAKRDQ